ncbi:restriction endonuclease subunit S [Bacillus inaquosorum]|uniref:restriction endonuclease subunit S n=1 Tax=Bacillus inaquosorum TaxID=483913 RepID=UPI0034CFFE26
MIVQKWSDVKLKYIAEINPSKSELLKIDDTEVTFIPMENILAPGNVDLSIKKSLADVYNGYTYFKEDDIIVAKVTPCFENGNIAIMEGLSNGIGFGTTELYVVRINKNKYNNKFFYYALQSDEFKKEAISNMYGVGGLKRIPLEFIRNYKFKVPQIQVQNKVVEFLSNKTESIMHLINHKERLIILLEEKRQSMIIEAVTKGLNLNVKMKDSGVEWIGEIPEHWDVVKIKRLTSVKRGASPRPIDNPIYFDDEGEYAWVRIADVSNSGMYLNRTTQRLSKLGSSLSVKMKPGDLFLSIAGTVGKPCITNINCCIHDGFVYFPNFKENIKYLYFIFDSGEPYKGLGKMGTQLNLNTDTVGMISIPVPPKEEQNKIVEFIEDQVNELNCLIDNIKKQIQKLKEYRQSLIYEAVTGKIDVREYELVPQ